MSCGVLPNRRTKLRLECLMASDTARLAALVASLPWTSTPMPISVIQRLSVIGFLQLSGDDFDFGRGGHAATPRPSCKLVQSVPPMPAPARAEPRSSHPIWETA